MTTTAFDDQFIQSTQTIEPVRQPYDTVAILRRNIAYMEVALRTQTERAEAAEAELEAVREDNCRQVQAQQARCEMITDSDAFHKYRELRVLSPFCENVTVKGEDIRLAFSDSAFRYWGNMGIIQFDLTVPDDVTRFLNTPFIMHIGDVVI